MVITCWDFMCRSSRACTGWHELKVQVSGDHGPVRTRSGYYLDSPGPAPKELETHTIDDAIVAALEYTGVLFNVEPGKWDDADRDDFLQTLRSPATAS